MLASNLLHTSTSLSSTYNNPYWSGFTPWFCVYWQCHVEWILQCLTLSLGLLGLNQFKLAKNWEAPCVHGSLSVHRLVVCFAGLLARFFPGRSTRWFKWAP